MIKPKETLKFTYFLNEKNVSMIWFSLCIHTLSHFAQVDKNNVKTYSQS